MITLNDELRVNVRGTKLDTNPFISLTSLDGNFCILIDYCSLLDIPIIPTTQSGFYEIHIVQSPLLQTSLNNDIFDVRVIGRRIYAAVVDAHLPDSFGNQN